MATFPIYHGITLAENSWVENFHFEILASDPMPLTAGRVWYNSTDKVFRQSTLNESGAVVVRTFATVEELEAEVGALESSIAAEVARATAAEAAIQAEVDAEEVRAAAAEAALQAEIDAEETRALAAEAALQAEIDAEETRALAAEAALQAEIDAEETRALAAEGVLQSAIDAEVARATAAEGVLQGNIDAVDARVDALGNAFNYVGALTGGTEVAPFDMATLPEGQKDSGDYYKVTTAGWFVVGAGTAFYANVGDGIVWNTFGGVDKIDNTDSNVSGTANEIAVTGSADTGFVVGIDGVFSGRVSTLESGLASEVSARQAADTALQGEIDAEETRALAAEGVLQGNIDAEVTRATAAEGALDTKIGDLSGLTTDAKTSVVAAINELDAALAGGTEAVRDAYDATIFTYESVTPATTHVINHNLNSAFVDFSVLIQRADGNWYNDIASIATSAANPTNVATLYLSVAQNVKVIARSAAKLGLVA